MQPCCFLIADFWPRPTACALQSGLSSGFAIQLHTIAHQLLKPEVVKVHWRKQAHLTPNVLAAETYRTYKEASGSLSGWGCRELSPHGCKDVGIPEQTVFLSKLLITCWKHFVFADSGYSFASYFNGCVFVFSLQRSGRKQPKTTDRNITKHLKHSII